MKKLIKYLYIFLMVMAGANAQGQTIGMRIDDVNSVTGETIDVPVYVDSSLTGKGAYSYQLELSYYDYYNEAIEVIVTGGVAEDFGSPSVNLETSGKITIAGAGATPLSGSGLFLTLRFQSIRQGNGYVNFTDNQHNYFNEGDPAMNFVNGNIYNAPAPKITIAPNSNLLLAGEQLQFTVSGDTVSPFIWDVETSDIASIDSEGLLTADAPGLTKVNITDNNGLFDETNYFIEVRGYKLSIADDLSEWQGSTIDIPINTSDLTDLDVLSGQLTLGYNATILEPVEIITAGTMLDGITPEVQFGTNTISMAFASVSALSGEGVLAYVRFSISSEYTGASGITMTDVVFNEDLYAIVDEGYFSTRNFANISISPNSKTLVAGDSVQVTGTYGELPYTWDTDDHSVATITSEGMLHSHLGGVVRVLVEDAVGATKTSGDFVVIDTRVSIPDTTGPVNSTFDLPILISELPSGQTVQSVEAKIQIQSTDIEFIELVTAGSLTDGWTKSSLLDGNILTVALAGTSGIDQAGELFFLRFNITPELTLGEHAYINLNELILNEGSPTALVDNGYIKGSKSEDLGVSSILAPLSGCDLSSTETVTVRFNNFGFVTYSSGEQLEVAYQIGSATPITESIILSEDLLPGGYVDYTFTTLADLSATGTYSFRAYSLLSAATDGNINNDMVTASVENIDFTVNLGADIIACEGSMVTLDAGTGYTSYVWEGHASTTNLLEVSDSGLYVVTVTNELGCETKDTVKLSFVPLPELSLGNDITLCEGDVIQLDAGSNLSGHVWNDGLTSAQTLNVSATGDYWVEITDINGCTNYSDTVHVEVIPEIQIELGEDYFVCEGTEVTLDAGAGFTSYAWSTGDTTQTITVIPMIESEYDVTVSTGSCSATDNITIKTNPSYFSSDSVTICDSGSYEWEGNIYSTSGTYLSANTSVNGCDSILELKLYVVTNFELEQSAVICQGDSILWEGNYYKETGDYSLTVSGASCDTVKHLYLEVVEFFHTEISAEICEGDLYFWEGENYGVAGDYQKTYTSVAGCDSIVELHLMVNAVYSNEMSATICSDDQYSWEGQLYNQTGVYQSVHTSVSGCDSILILNLEVVSEIHVVDSAQICTGGSYDWEGSSYNTAGTYEITVPSALSCDTVKTLVLEVVEFFLTEERGVICEGESFLWEGNAYDTAGTYQATYTSTGGCDSIVELTLHVLPKYLIEETMAICAGDSVEWHGNVYSEPGTYSVNYSSETSCDSSFQLTLEAAATIEHAISGEVCSGGSYNFGSQSLTTAGTYTEVFESASGCDSIVTLTLSIGDPIENAISAAICSGDSYTFGSQTLSTAGTYVEIFESASGCDSVVTLTLSEKFGHESESLAFICPGETYEWEGSTYSSEGRYTVSYPSANGCDSVLVLVLNELSSPVTPGITLDERTLTSSASTGNQWYLDNNMIQGANGTAHTAEVEGDYHVVVTNSNGCVSEPSNVITVVFTGISDLGTWQLNIYPNPAKGQVFVSNNSGKALKLEVVDLTGKVLLQQELKGNLEMLDLQSLPASVYYFKVQYKDEVSIERVILK